MRMKKKTMFLMLIFLFVFGIQAYAEENNEIIAYVTEFANELCEDYVLEVSDIQSVYDVNGEYGYYIKFESESVPCGYVIYSNKIHDIEEFCFDYGKDGILDDEEEQEREILYKKNALEYEIVSSGESEENAVLSSGTSNKDYLDDMIQDSPSVANNSQYSLLKYNYLRKRYMYTEKIVTNWGVKEDLLGCAPVAMMNVCAQCGILDTSSKPKLKNAYEILHTLAGTDGEGNTADNLIGDTIQRFAKAIGNVDITYTFKRNPSLSYFTKAVDNDYSAILGLVGRDGGHAVSVNGYIKYKHKTTGAIKTYLQVADGWNDRTRSILYNEINAETSGIVVEYKTH